VQSDGQREGPSGTRAHADVIPSPFALSATVHDAFLPGGAPFNDGKILDGVPASPTQSVKFLYFPVKGETLSGHSTSIDRAFASSLAGTDRNAGVGVTSFIGGSPSDSNPDSVEQLVAQASMEQTFHYSGTEDTTMSLTLHIPSIEIGLIEVPPQRTGQSATETAEAEATLDVDIIHSDATLTHIHFEFGLKAFEKQLPSGQQLLNVANVDTIAKGPGADDSLFSTFQVSGSDADPRFLIDDVKTDVDFGTIKPGDSISYLYQLTAQGTTIGGEQGFMAFLGDPFGGAPISDNLILNVGSLTTPGVPEPATWVLMIVGFGVVAGLASRRARRCRDRSIDHRAGEDWRHRALHAIRPLLVAAIKDGHRAVRSAAS
jgi:hypothetical protein